jgi:glycosyltransferase involved in cell wall biosynthesis
MPEIVTDEVGALVPPDDPAALAAAIVSTVRRAAEPETPKRCAAHAASWSWDVVGPAHIAAYDAARSA